MQELNENDFHATLTETEGLSVVQMTAPWCGPCRMLAPRLAEMEDEGTFNYFKVNVDDNPGLAGDFKVMSIPTLLVYLNGKHVHTVIGAVTKNKLLDEIKDFL